MLTYPWKCTVLHCNHLGNTWKLLVLMTQHFDYYSSASEGDNQSVGSSAPVVSRCFPGGYNVKLYISRGRLAWWLLAFLCCVSQEPQMTLLCFKMISRYFIKYLEMTHGHTGLMVYYRYTISCIYGVTIDKHCDKIVHYKGV